MSNEEYEDIHYGSGYLDDDRTIEEIIEDLTKVRNEKDN